MWWVRLDDKITRSQRDALLARVREVGLTRHIELRLEMSMRGGMRAAIKAGRFINVSEMQSIRYGVDIRIAAEDTSRGAVGVVVDGTSPEGAATLGSTSARRAKARASTQTSSRSVHLIATPVATRAIQH